jgi:hypothetical protein
MQLYTVRMKRKQIVTIYGAQKNTISEERLIDEVYHDLPHKTALAYKTKFPDAQVVIEAQAEMTSPRSSRDFRPKVDAGAKREIVRTKPTPRPETGIHTGGYAEAINKAMESSL